MLTKLFFDALFAIADALVLVGVTALINVVLGTTSNIPYIEIFGWCWWAAFFAKGGLIYPKEGIK